MDGPSSPRLRPLTTPQPDSPSPLPANSFPTPLPPPLNLPVRLPPLLTAETSGVPGISNGRILDGTEDENRNAEAWNALMQHKKERMPLVINASERLHAVLGLRNEFSFELPETPSSVLANRAALYDIPDAGSLGLGISLDGGKKAKDVARGVKRDLDGTGPKVTTGLSATVEKETGKGLREFLLLKGKEGGMKKISCKRVTFHDFTPDLRTDQYRNRIVGNYVAERGARVDFYEVELYVLSLPFSPDWC
jgi:hypothetical protein